VCSCLTENGFDWAVEALRAEGPQSLFGTCAGATGRLHSTDTRLWLARMGSETRVFALARATARPPGRGRGARALAHLVEAASELVAQFDEAGRLTYVNPAGLALLGYRARRGRERAHAGRAVRPRPARADRGDRATARAARALGGPELLRSWQDDRRTPCWAQVFAVRHSRSEAPSGLALVARDDAARGARRLAARAPLAPGRGLAPRRDLAARAATT
jgi:PAS domain-containing protein